MRLRQLLATAVLLTSTLAMAQIPRSKHVVVVTLENHSYEQAVGNPSMPYFNSLIPKGGIADQYYATMHNSLSTLMWLVAGQTVTTNDNTMQVFDVDSIVRHMQKDGRTWKSYQSQLPYVGYMGFNVNEYVKRHNPLSYFTDVQGALSANFVPTVPHFQNDIAKGALPEYSYVTPDLKEDAHDGTLAEADAWLAANIPQLLASPKFKEDGILFIVWDEGSVNPVDSRGTGGRIATLVLGPKVKKGFHSEVQYNHQSLLRSTCLALALTGCPGGGADGVPMIDFFNANKSGMLQVNLTSPALNNVDGMLHLRATGTSGPYVATGMAAYLGGELVAKSSTPSLSADLNVAPGTYSLTVRGWDASGATSDVVRTITVAGPKLAVNLLFPTTTNVSGALHILAAGQSGEYATTGMAAYISNKLVMKTTTPSLETYVNEAPGGYNVTVKVWDTKGNSASTQYAVTIH
ncbi:MAG TPA: alkaline phosphatase family protein [Candidatus Koribacter sp.]|jgi:acid phosphatase